jgi:MoxR-like ATPase
MKLGAVLLLDEVDLGTPKIMCLQPVLEGKAIYIKKTNQVVVPKKGFNVFATANTKGTGSSGGSFIGTMILNEAFLERFAITIEQEYPPRAVEIKIINRLLERGGEMENDWLAKELVDWANGTRDGYLNGSTFELISTRRLVHIVNAYMIFKDIEKALDLTLSRFEKTTKEMFKLAFMKIHDQAKTQAEILQRANRLVEELPDPDEFTPVSDAAVLSAMGGDAVAKQFQKSLDAATNQAFGEMKGHGSWATMIANS